MKQHNLKHQQGATLLLTFVFMLGMLAMVGLALDTGHVLVNKTRFQNALDAAALSAAITLNGPGVNSTTDAINAGIATFNQFKGSKGNDELTGVTLTATDFSFSDRVNLFSAGLGGTPNFVRVISNALQLDNFFIQVVTGNAKESVGAVSTAGPIGQNCNLVPLVVCADVDPATGTMDKDCTTDNDGDGFVDCYGYNMNEESELHTKFCAPNDTACQATALEAGNFTLLRWTDSAGKNDIRNSLSGEVNSCAVGVELETDPGNAVGPVSQGINDRFDADTVTQTYDHITNPTASTPAYNDYLFDQFNPDNLSGKKNNRVVAAPVGDCNGIQNGNTTFDFATDGSGNMAAMCLLIRRPVRDTGPNNDPDYLKNSIYIEMLELCPALGQTNPENPVIFGPFRIVLFKSEDSNNS